MADGTHRPLRELRVGDEIYGTRREGWYRRFTRTHVVAHWETVKPAYSIILADGTHLVASGDHRFLTERGWKHVTNTAGGRKERAHLTTNNSLMGTGHFALAPEPDLDYRRGYLAGIIRGDAHLAGGCAGRSTGHGRALFRLALVDGEALRRAQSYLAEFGIALEERVFQAATGLRKQMNCIRTGATSFVRRILELIGWPSDPSPTWRRGFLAGIFDAEGSYSQGVLRIFNTDQELIDWTTSSVRGFGLRYVMEQAPGTNRPVHVVRITGGLTAHLRFFHSIGNAIARKRDIQGAAVKTNAALNVVSIEPLGEMPLYDITTGTGDFIADGVVSHNCYARPFHEYLGFSAGLDFETKILVKPEAPELLRRELMSPSWEPQLVMMSGVTDCYQPAERRLGITRRCLEVLAELRNPTGVITKNRLVTRDSDLLGELAAHRAAAVTLSITTLDADLARRMEPRASTPRDRLAAVRELAAAGVPVGVNVSPVVPALTDHELPAILAAAKEAGAHWARYQIVRLPFAVKELFQEWLDEHFPERKEKVLARLRNLRDGQLNDPRFGKRHSGEGAFAEQIRALYETTCRRLGLPTKSPELSAAAFRRPGQQLGLF
jgi:DNA repair photolyase